MACRSVVVPLRICVSAPASGPLACLVLFLCAWSASSLSVSISLVLPLPVFYFCLFVCLFPRKARTCQAGGGGGQPVGI